MSFSSWIYSVLGTNNASNNRTYGQMVFSDRSVHPNDETTHVAEREHRYKRRFPRRVFFFLCLPIALTLSLVGIGVGVMLIQLNRQTTAPTLGTASTTSSATIAAATSTITSATTATAISTTSSATTATAISTTSSATTATAISTTSSATTATAISTTSSATTATTTSTTTSTTTACSINGMGNLLACKAGPTSWTSYNYTYTAVVPNPTLTFTFRGTGSSVNYLDGVSVIDTTAPGVQLLRNPSFENSSTAITGWITWCSYACTGSTDSARITNSNCRSLSGTFCVMDSCQSNADFVGQSFAAIVGRTYSISFWLQQVGANGRFCADIL